jgi:hypothetical protein
MSDQLLTFKEPRLTTAPDDLRMYLASMLDPSTGEEDQAVYKALIKEEYGLTAEVNTALVGGYFFTDTDWHVDYEADPDSPSVLRFIVTGTCPDVAVCNMVISDQATEEVMNLAPETAVPMRPKTTEMFTFFDSKFGRNWLETAADKTIRTKKQDGIDDYLSVRDLEIKRILPNTLAEMDIQSFLHRSRLRGKDDYFRRVIAKGTVAVSEFYSEIFAQEKPVVAKL